MPASPATPNGTGNAAIFSPCVRYTVWRVCLLFALFWGFLALALLRVVHPVVERLTALLPPWLFVPALLFTLLDGVLTFYVLRRARDTGALRWYLRAKRHAA